MEHNENIPKMLTIREVARTGLLSEYTLRLLHKQGKLPCIDIPGKTLVNYTLLKQQLQELTGIKGGSGV